jgi:hypothetical protein
MSLFGSAGCNEALKAPEIAGRNEESLILAILQIH